MKLDLDVVVVSATRDRDAGCVIVVVGAFGALEVSDAIQAANSFQAKFPCRVCVDLSGKVLFRKDGLA